MIYFHSDKVDKDVNKERRDKMEHNGSAFRLIRDVASAMTAVIVLGATAKKCMDEK